MRPVMYQDRLRNQTMSFLAYILRGANESLRQYQDTIPHASVRLLQDCPPDAPNIRKVTLGMFCCFSSINSVRP
jgi:hypothetical protein